MNWSEQLSQPLSSEFFRDVLFGEILVNLAIAILLGQILTWHYLRFAQVLSNRTKFSRLFVFISTTTFLIITVVKSSLALSLGLVGALSIIRFRTPIKEPEELAYLFLAIAVGVGLGAGGGPATAATVVVFVVIVTFLGLRSMITRGNVPQRTILQVTAPLGVDAEEAEGPRRVESMLPIVRQHCQRVELRRIDSTRGEVHASFVVELSGERDVTTLLGALRGATPDLTVSLVEWDGLE